MKELSIEEKAKAYDKALVIAKSRYSIETEESIRICLKLMFPELKESEDEMIRKHLIKHFRNKSKEDWNGISVKSILVWLEKQVEHANFRNKIQIGDKVTRNEDGMLVNLSQLNRVAKKDEKQGEQKTSEDEDREYACQSSEHFTRRELMIYNRGIADGKRMIEDTIKETEQKPAWSEEDEEIKNIISGTLDLIYEKNICFENKSKNDCMFWLNSLIMRVQPQPKQEWSEEDEKKRTLLIDILEVNHPNGYFKVNPVNTSNMEAMYTEELISWLKSLKPHSKQEWNEGDEAMLKCCINSLELTPEITESYFVIDGKHITSKELQNWLKSLKPQSQYVELPTGWKYQR